MNEEKASQTNDSSKEDQLNDEKYLRYYSFLLDGFHSCSVEIDKNLTNISVLSIAAVLLVQLPNIQHFWQLIILFLSIVSFLITIICVLINYKNSKKYLLSIMAESENMGALNKKVKIIAKIAFLAFCSGALFFTIAVISTAFLIIS